MDTITQSSTNGQAVKIIILILAAMPAFAGDFAYKASVGASFGVNIADVLTTRGGMEANPMLRGPDGRLGAQGVALKFAVTGATALAAHYMYRHGHKRAAAVLNFTTAGVTSYAVVHNMRVR